LSVSFGICGAAPAVVNLVPRLAMHQAGLEVGFWEVAVMEH